MSFNISAWSIRNPVPTIVLFLILTLAGMIAFPFLGINDNPNIDVPSVVVTVTQPGADPTELETQVTRKIEDAVASLGNIDDITSTVNDGSSVTAINFVLGTNTDRATNDVRNAVAQIRQNLPQDINDPIVKRLEFAGGGPVATYTVSSDQRSVAELSNFVDQTVSRAVLAVPGVAQVDRIGGVDREIRVNLQPDRLQSLGITATQVNDQVRQFNINLSGGRSQVGGNEQSIRTLGSAASLSALRELQIAMPQGGFVPLSSLGEVIDGAGDIRRIARLNNQPTVVFAVNRSTDTTLAAVEAGAAAAIAKLKSTIAPDIKIELLNNVEAVYIRQSYEASIEAVVLGALLAIVTIWLFLRDWRATLITAVALPLSLIPTFVVMKLLDYTLNDLTLLALALVVGVLVDDAIVEIENIERHIKMGKTPYQAAIDASDEIGLAVVATTFTIVSVFGPVAFMTGITGQFFRPFGLTVAASVLFSLLVARMITPMMAAYLMPAHATSHGAKPDRLAANYRGLLSWALKHRLLTLAIALMFFIGSLALVPRIPVGLFSKVDISLSVINMELPPGSTIDDTDQASQTFTRLLLQHPAVQAVQTDQSVTKSTFFVKLKPREVRKINREEFEKQVRPLFKSIPGVRLSFNKGGPAGGSKELSVVLKSENPTALLQAATALEQQMKQVPGLVEVTSSASLVKPEILIKPDPVRAAQQGLTVAQIARIANLATLGDFDANLAKFDLPDRQVPIRVQLDPKYRNNIDTIKNLEIPNASGALVPLQSVADISFGSGPARIARYNRSRNISVEANLQGAALGDALGKVNQLPALQNLPAGVTRENLGNAKILGQIVGNFGGALLAALIFIYVVLTLLFNDFLHPITIMVALPFSIGGALLGLLLGHKELGIIALIGMVLLLGLVTKNSILLVDYALMNQREGKSMYQAVLYSGVARLRPILMTTIAMIAGMIPIALGIGAGSEGRSPMAIAVIGGLTTSTLLTLIVVPVIFTYVDRWQAIIFGKLLKGSMQRRAGDIVKG